MTHASECRAEDHAPTIGRLLDRRVIRGREQIMHRVSQEFLRAKRTSGNAQRWTFTSTCIDARCLFKRDWGANADTAASKRIHCRVERVAETGRKGSRVDGR